MRSSLNASPTCLLNSPITVCSTVSGCPARAPRLAVVFGSDRSRWDSAFQLQSHSGIAPVTECSGKALWLTIGWLVRNSSSRLFMSSRTSPFASPNGLAPTTTNNAAGVTIITPLCAPWRILFRWWKDRKPCDGQKYSQSLGRRGSALVELLLDCTNQMSIPPLPKGPMISYGPRLSPGERHLLVSA